MKKFLNILSDLKLSHEMTELFETVECEKVAASRDHSRIKIYIHSDRLIAHKAIRETERAIRSQMFKDQVDVCLVEKYHLSRQYTPARLLEAYTGSLIDELEEEGITVRLGGPTCLSGDVIGEYKFRQLPEYEDLLMFGDMAIYTTCKNNTFNGMPLPNIWLRRADNTMQQLTDFGYMDFKERLGSRE